jgi:hypothetical protein
MESSCSQPVPSAVPDVAHHPEQAALPVSPGAEPQKVAPSALPDGAAEPSEDAAQMAPAVPPQLSHPQHQVPEASK